MQIKCKDSLKSYIAKLKSSLFPWESYQKFQFSNIPPRGELGVMLKANDY